MPILEYWFQSLYKRAVGRYRSAANASAVDCEGESRRLGVLLQLLSQLPCEVGVSDISTVWVSENRVRLPRWFNPTADRQTNRRLLDYAVVVAAQSLRELKFGKKMQFEAAKLEKESLKAFPGLRPLIDLINQLEKSDPAIRERLGPTVKIGRPISREYQGDALNTSQKQKSGGRVKAEPQLELVDVVEGETNPLVHSFEKVQTAEEYEAGSRTLDDLDEGANEQGAFDEMRFSKIIRTNRPSQSMAESSVCIESIGDQTPSQISGKTEEFLYSEWSVRHRRFLKNWCRVLCDQMDPVDKVFEVPKEIKKLGSELRSVVQGYLNTRGWRRGFEDGQEIDIDAIIRYYATPVSNRPGVTQFFQRRVLTHQDFAFVIALDVSLSSDSWVNNRRILDIEKNVAHILGVGFCRSQFQIEVCAFHSVTKNACRYTVLKEFAQGWEGVHGKIGVLGAQGYTRLGPLIRHATHRLGSIQSRRKVICLLSDAKPTDYDPYEGSHGVHDVGKACLEAVALGVHVEAMTLGGKNEKRFEVMFGRGNYTCVDTESRAVRQIAQLFMKMTR